MRLEASFFLLYHFQKILRKCGIIRKENRNRDNHMYHCHNCGYTSNDDRVAAMNIYELGKWFVSGVEKPRFEIIENEKW